ncbi:MAG: CCA tRNA nucleotidyltransferase [Alphaproteobacteria bacterium]|nr:CCA tRNA nucleotidyltransferase [Alphaproteobacteria bacterium]
MTAPETRRVVAALTKEGAVVRFCGGAVRDALVGVDAADVDLATPDPPETVTRLAAVAGLSTRPTGIDHGTVTVIADRRPFEVTTLRRDVETFGRRARVAFTDDWQADAARRDFTINALYADPEGRLHDFFDGAADLAAGRVRFIGEADRRIHEDALRILRFFRFHARFGKGAPDAESLAACRALASLARGLSGERVRQELFRLLIGPRPDYAVRLMAEAGVLEVVLPDATQIDRLARLAAREPEADALRRLGALLDRGADETATRLRLSNAETRRLLEMCPPLALAPSADEGARRRALYAYEAVRVRDGAWLALAETGDDRFTAWIEASKTWRRPKLPVGGEDAQRFGIAKGPSLGEALRRVEDAWIASGFTLDREACLALLSGRA